MVWKTLKPYVLITLSCIPYAFAFNVFYAPNNFTCGGFTGIAQIIHAFFPQIGVGVMVILLNVPLFVLSLRRFGVRVQLYSMFAMALSSAMLDGLAALYAFEPLEPLLACLYGGVLLGASLGWMLREEATTGGTELAAKLLKCAIPHLSIGKLCMALDLLVIVAYAAVFRSVENALYGAVALYVSSNVMDLVVYGGKAAKVAYIISPAHEQITQQLLANDMGVTLLHARGAYSGGENPVLLCAIRRREIVWVRRVVKELDPNAFFIVCDAREVLGEGFGEYDANGL